MTDKTRGRGRPAFSPSIEQRQTVEQMKYCGESENVIARALKIDVDTLRKHFVEELGDGHASRRREVIGMLFSSARSGNVSAIRKLEEQGRAAGAAEAIERRSDPTPKTEKLGKKEERQQAAERVGGIFTPPEPPKLVVSNGR